MRRLRKAVLRRDGPQQLTYVVADFGDVFLSIEGNTNDGGSREGHEVCRRIRSFKDKDFIQTPN